jgi:hypothetical protein
VIKVTFSCSTNPHFTQGVTANVQLKSSIPIDAKVEISLKGFVLRVKAEIAKSFQFSSSYKKMLNFMALYWPQG